ncbi:class I SAM-dependent methyltransferase [Ponticaulis sp.]|uniref:class I SAM-dependent methyltransferase n=1 Tax=Ponticaulis sp. TaxID=2020902 RepID=UPI00260BEDFD|nr:class I SAM-dependent methyltransferase [Ponticaulis sp.]MDF1678957.1 class I SAM-dependent methyltransferase [Ponticaulis sp.]
MQAESTRDQRFWDKIADRYAAKKIDDEAVYQEKVTLTQAYLNPEMKALEFGCGTGSTALLHAPFVQHILATDLSPAMLEHGRLKADAGGIENITFQHTSVEDFEAEDESFDAVLALNLLHLCEDPWAVIAKIHDLLKPGGVFIQSTPCLSDYGAVTQFAIPVMRAIGKAPSTTHFSTDQLEQKLDETGFRIDRFWQPAKGSCFIVCRKSPD